MKNIFNVVTILVLTAFLVGCSSDNDELVKGNLKVELTGLEELGADFVYEGWLIVDGTPISTGTFTSVIFPQSFPVNISDLENATTFVLSIEPAIDNDPAPAATKLLAGDFSGNSATVNSTGIVADFANASGKYILATPTDMDATNEASGVWFLDNSSGMPAVGLNLPTLSAGWQYEGWVVLNGTPVSTGTFLSAAGADDNAATSPYKGTTNNGPAYPGEDFVMGTAAGVNFPTDLRETTVVISVEPMPDNSTAPFVLKPLAHMVPANAMTHTAISMGAGPVAMLSGSVSR